MLSPDSDAVTFVAESAVPERQGSAVKWHGSLGVRDKFDLPRQAVKSDEYARPGYDSCTASEFLDSEEVLRAKVRILAGLVKQHGRAGSLVIYTGAGISTASGIGDYASRAAGNRAPHKTSSESSSTNRLEARPTFAHKALAALERKGLLQHWVQQNHDRLAQKAGFPQSKLHEIHGAWGDNKNSVLMMDDKLRPDLIDWLEDWQERTTLVIAIGTSLCGMTSDGVAQAASAIAEGGLVIINLQQTRMDADSCLRIWGLADHVVELLVKELGVAVPDREAKSLGEEWVQEHPSCKYNTPKRTTKSPV